MGENGIEQKDFIYFSEENTNKTEGLMNIEYDKEGLVGALLGPLGELLGDILHALLGALCLIYHYWDRFYRPYR